jgi:hypothetical protein
VPRRALALFRLASENDYLDRLCATTDFHGASLQVVGLRDCLYPARLKMRPAVTAASWVMLRHRRPPLRNRKGAVVVGIEDLMQDPDGQHTVGDGAHCDTHQQPNDNRQDQ